MKKIILHTDGGARGNPGPAAIGITLESDDGAGNQVLIGEIKRYIGEQTNNFAEYTALITALEEAHKLGYSAADCFLDSELVVRQVKGEYKVREETLKPLHAKVQALIKHFSLITFNHVRREKNAEADRLVNEALDAETGETV